MKLDQSLSVVSPPPRGQFDAWVTRSPSAEAHDLYRMVRYGNCTIASIRELIAVPANIEESLMAYANCYPEDAGRIVRVLRFRESVLKEFNRLLEPDAIFRAA